MTARQYVKKIVKKIKCGGIRKEEIKKQLLMDINLRMNQGEKLEDIISGMGTIQEVADSFNENISPDEKKKYLRSKIFKIVTPIVLILAVLIYFVYWILPRGIDIENSMYFDKTQVENTMKNTIELLDSGDYTSLQENAIAQMQTVLNEESMEGAKQQISDDWGKRLQFGNAYIAEIVQQNTHYAVGEVTVTYDNVSVVYRLTFDENMQLAGLYMR